MLAMTGSENNACNHARLIRLKIHLDFLLPLEVLL
jgi:hypothetical protein